MSRIDLRRAASSRWLVFFLTLFVHGLTTRGKHASGDTSLYIKLADEFAKNHFSGAFNLDAVRWTKAIYLLILAAARSWTPAHWVGVMLTLNVLCSAFAAVLLFDLAQRASRSAVTPYIALLFYLGCYEVFQWMHYVLTDPLYLAISFVPFYLVSRRILIEGEPPRTLLLILSIVAACFCRPPGAVLVPLVLFVLLVLVEQRVSAKTATAIIVTLAVVALFVRAVVAHDPQSWPVPWLKPKIIELSLREKSGEVLQDRKECFRPPPQTATDHAIIVVDRFARFFQITTSGFSRMHNLINLAYFVPLYAFGLFAVIDAFRSDDRRRRAFVIALLMWIGVFAYFLALTALDFDWRFRTPLMPHLILLAMCGVDALIAGRSPGAAVPAR